MRFATASATIIVATLALTPASSTAQSSLSPQPEQPIGAIVGGVIGAGVGVVAVGFATAAIACDAGCEEFEGLGWGIVGAVIGEVLFLPVGVHVGNGSKGNLALDVGVSLGLAAGTFLVAGALQSDALGLMGLVAQVWGTVWVERTVGARRGREIRIQSRALPDGRMGLGLGIRF